MKNRYLECAKVINKRGIGGELKAECYCDSPSALKKAKVLYTDSCANESHTVVSIKEYKGFLYIKLADINGPDEADMMRGKILYADRNEITVDDGRIFIADLVGLDVIDADTGKNYGKIENVENYGASDIYLIRGNGKLYMLPAVDGIIVEQNLDSHVLVRPIDGIFDDAEEIR